MNLRHALAASAAAALTLLAQTAQADVRYDFTALSSFDFDGERFAGSFSVVVPDFIVTDTSIPAASLLSCSASSNFGPATCLNQDFLFDIATGYDTVSFGVSTETTANIGVYYYFNDGDFSALGTHYSQIFGSDQAAILTVSSVSAVPEPSTWSSLAIGLGVGGIGGLVMRRRGAAGSQRT